MIKHGTYTSKKGINYHYNLSIYENDNTAHCETFIIKSDRKHGYIEEYRKLTNELKCYLEEMYNLNSVW